MEAQARQQRSQMPPAGEVRAHLARLLASGAFPATARGRELLGYVVEQMLAGRGEQLKAYNLAVSVLGRDSDFDAQSDPIVRIEMRRLRRDLEHYYLGEEGRAEPIRITIPKGRYVPDFEAREQELTPEAATPVAWPPGRFGRRGVRLLRAGGAAGLGLFLLVAVIGASLAWSVREQGQHPAPPSSSCRSNRSPPVRTGNCWRKA
jgi:hypothetical protein